MGLNLFPHQQNAAISSKYTSILRYIRIGSFISLIISFVYNLIFSDFDPLGIEFTTMIFALIFESLAILTYRNPDMNKLTCLVFVVVWTYTTTLELADMILIGRHGIFDIVFFVPWLTLFLDFLLNQISILRIQYVFPVAFIALFLFVLPNEFDTPFFLFSAFEKFLLYLLIFGFSIIVLEFSRVVKVGSCRETGTVQQHLL